MISRLTKLYSTLVIQVIGILLLLVFGLFIACAPTPVPVDDETLPKFGEFIEVEKPAEMIKEATPVYSRQAQSMGLRGVVWVTALVGKNGKVVRSQVARSSGHTLLDQAAVDSAMKCLYMPGIQAGKPVAMWVTYKVEFKL